MVDCFIVHLGLSRWLIVVLHLGCPSFSCSAFTVRTMRYTSDISVPFTHTGDSTSNLSFQSCISPITRHLMISIQQRIAIVAISCPTHVHCSTQYTLTNLLQYLVYIPKHIQPVSANCKRPPLPVDSSIVIICYLPTIVVYVYAVCRCTHNTIDAVQLFLQEYFC